MTLSAHQRAKKAVESCLIFMMMLAGTALAQNPSRMADGYIRTDFTVEDGLPDNVVNAVVQSENGLLWVGTQSGLASFDGRDFTAIDLSTAGFPSQGAVSALLESSEGDLWVGTDAGLVLIPRPALDRFDPKLMTFYHLGSGTSGEVERSPSGSRRCDVGRNRSRPLSSGLRQICGSDPRLIG